MTCTVGECPGCELGSMIWVDHKTASSGAAAFSLPAPHYGVALVAFAEHQAERLMVALGEVKPTHSFQCSLSPRTHPHWQAISTWLLTVRCALSHLRGAGLLCESGYDPTLPPTHSRIQLFTHAGWDVLASLGQLPTRAIRPGRSPSSAAEYVNRVPGAAGQHHRRCREVQAPTPQ